MRAYQVTLKYEQDGLAKNDVELIIEVQAQDETHALELAKIWASEKRPDLPKSKTWFWAIEREI